MLFGSPPQGQAAESQSSGRKYPTTLYRNWSKYLVAKGNIPRFRTRGNAIAYIAKLRQTLPTSWLDREAFSTHPVLPPTSTVRIFMALFRVAAPAEGLSWTLKLKAVPAVLLDAG
ncbi:hypothetical protein N7474_001184 [Penicillium riverlandense]|uniref:uncharacterized protein n=1 Tax=Penicillium riverlandense TaxID=1903569 RepID=UPI0025497BC8|nr:uncharacterized protein N7474_001184 [Penicillium riverlandense]KAJ5832873.1 hypothetical protein N7474_001184 [Penicillium riverlandense]